VTSLDLSEFDPQSLAVRCAETMLAADAAAAALGIRLVSADEGQAELAMTVTRQMLNAHRIGHGGVVFTLADTAFAVACNSYNRVTVAAACTIEFLAPAAEGDELTATAVERYRRGRSGLYDVTVRRPDGTQIAELRGRGREVGGSLV